MKISTFFLATIAQFRPSQAKESARIFIDEESFMNIDNKNFKLEEEYLNDQLAEIRDSRTKLILDFPPSHHKRGEIVKNKINDQFERLENRLRNQTEKCFRDFNIVYIPESSDAYVGNQLTSVTMYNRFQSGVARKMAVYIRQVFSTGSPRCTKQQVILMRRLERLRLITLWHYCHKFDSTVAQCSWAYLDEKTNQPRVHPRNQTWIEQKFGRNTPFQQRTVVCDIDAGANDIEQTISCRDNKKLVINSAFFGRQNVHECLGDFQKGDFSVCDHEEDVKSSIASECENQANCTLTTDLIPEENKVFCQESENYLLVHYSCEE